MLRTRYAFRMAAVVNPLIQQIVEQAAALLPSERAQLVRRVEAAHARDATTFSVDEMEKSLRSELDF